jgi:hypothetical protein
MLDLALKGVQRVISLTAAAGGAGALTLDLKPDPGKLWVVQYAVAFQVSGSSLTLGWSFIDPVTTSILAGAVTLADYEVLAWDAHTKNVRGLANQPPTLSSTRFLRATLTATGAGDDIYIKALVSELLGMQT